MMQVTVTFHVMVKKNSRLPTLIYQLKKESNLHGTQGKEIDYEGATAVNFTEVGEAFGSFLEKEINGGKFSTKKQR